MYFGKKCFLQYRFPGSAGSWYCYVNHKSSPKERCIGLRIRPTNPQSLCEELCIQNPLSKKAIERWHLKFFHFNFWTHVPKLNLIQLALQGTAFVSCRAVNQVQSWALFPVEFPLHLSLVWIRKVMAERENGYHYNSPVPQG